MCVFAVHGPPFTGRPNNWARRSDGEGIPARQAPRWAALAAAGARPQRPLWASTSVKDPAYPDTRYVTDLVAPGVINTMPETTLRAVADHGQIPADSVRRSYQDARQVLSQLQELGVDYDDVTEDLEKHGLELFDTSWRELSDQLAATFRPPRKESRT